MLLEQLREKYHKNLAGLLFDNVSELVGGNNTRNRIYRDLANNFLERYGVSLEKDRIFNDPNFYKQLIQSYLEEIFGYINQLQSASWKLATIEQLDVFRLDKRIYKLLRHLQVSATSLSLHPNILTPDIFIGKLTLHTIVSLKWFLEGEQSDYFLLVRKDQDQSQFPHLVVITAEPTPHRLASLALGTGDLDCVYHFALYELLESTKRLGYDNAHDEIQMMVEGRRLRDISDLPFDLVV